MKRQVVLGIALLALLVTASACGSGADQGSRWPRVLEIKDRDIIPLLVQHTLTVGDDRFSLGLQDTENQLILRANVTFRFFKIEGERGTLKAEMPATYVGFDTNFVHEHEDGTQHTHIGPEVGVYVARFVFDEPGDWGVEVNGERDGQRFDPIQVRFGVLEQGIDTVPVIGDPAPRTQQVTLRDVGDISEIDTTNPPNPEMHELTVAEALDTGKPVVVAFATPAFCTSRTCGPVMDKVVVPLFEKYRDRAVFIHIEPYDLMKARAGDGLVPVPAMEEWGLSTEPWVFVIDREGSIAAKFEGIMGADEVEAVLTSLVQS
jgi:hypothetical protein